LAAGHGGRLVQQSHYSDLLMGSPYTDWELRIGKTDFAALLRKANHF
jgi:hypothetical protein